MTHAIELAITAYLVFERGIIGRPRMSSGSKQPDDHDLLALYEDAVRRGLNSNPVILKDLPFLSELHSLHYARYPQVESKGVPAFISQYNDMIDQLFADISNALGSVSQIKG